MSDPWLGVTTPVTTRTELAIKARRCPACGQPPKTQLEWRTHHEWEQEDDVTLVALRRESNPLLRGTKTR